MEVHGFCDPKFDAVREAMVQNFEQHGDVGASVALTLEGEFVCDLWAGVTSEGGTDPWKEARWSTFGHHQDNGGTLRTGPQRSRTTRSSSTGCQVLAGIRSKWKRAGVSQSLPAHSAGLSGLDDIISNETLYDWDAMCRLLAEQAPWWPPGSASGYHAITQGHLIGEVSPYHGPHTGPILCPRHCRTTECRFPHWHPRAPIRSYCDALTAWRGGYPLN